MTPKFRFIMRTTLFAVFVIAFVITIVATIWAFLLQAGAFGPPAVKQVPHLGTLITAVIIEVVAAIIALWYDLFGLRKTADRTDEPQEVPDSFEKRLTNCVVAVRKGDIFKCHSKTSAVIYPANVHFDSTFTDDVVDPKRSTLGLYISNRVGKAAIPAFDDSIDSAIAAAGLQPIGKTALPGKPGRQEIYDAGSAIAVRNKSDQVILFALTQLTKPGQHYLASLDEETFVQALSHLWKSIEKIGVRGELYMPVVGAGFGRINPQSALAHILLSFRAAAERCKGRLCDKLVVVVYHGNWADGRWVQSIFNGLLTD